MTIRRTLAALAAISTLTVVWLRWALARLPESHDEPLIRPADVVIDAALGGRDLTAAERRIVTAWLAS